jgi:hypothetical protein
VADSDRGVCRVVEHRMQVGGVNGDFPHCMSTWPWRREGKLTEYIPRIGEDHW